MYIIIVDHNFMQYVNHNILYDHDHTFMHFISYTIVDYYHKQQSYARESFTGFDDFL